MRISDWSSDVCSSDLVRRGADGSKDRKGRGRANEGGHAFHIDLSLWIGAMPIGFRATPRSDLWWRLVRGHLVDAAERGAAGAAFGKTGKIGRASCRERECQYV